MRKRIDVPDGLPQGRDGEREGAGSAAVLWLQLDGHTRGSIGRRIEVGDHEALLELTARVAFGEEPVIGKRLHCNHIRAAGDGAGVAAVDVAEVRGSFDRYRLR